MTATSRTSRRGLATALLLTLSSLALVWASPASAAVSQEAPVDGFALVGPEYREGSTGVEVFWMQIQLVNRGFFLSDFAGYYGASTRHAVTAMQKYFGLPRTGRVDALTRFALAGVDDRVSPRFAIGGRAIDIDLGRQIMFTTVEGGTEWVFDISSGKGSTPTPRGIFRVQRQINALRVSRLGQLWRPKYFTGGYAIHGSPSVPNYPASHGCVRLTNQEIDYIWGAGLAPIGTPMVIV